MGGRGQGEGGNEERARTEGYTPQTGVDRTMAWVCQGRSNECE